MRDGLDVELSLRAGTRGRYRAALRVAGTGDIVQTFGPFEIAIARERLLALAAQPEAYGLFLSKALFRSGELREAFARVRGTAGQAGFRLRLAIEVDAEKLCALRWELLRLPGEHTPLSAREDVRFSRYLGTGKDTSPPGPPAGLRALVAIAAPDNLVECGYDPIDRAAEVERAQRGLGEMTIDWLGREANDPCTFQRLAGCLEDRDILYLVCHGRTTSNGSFLILENENGRADGIPAEWLARRLEGMLRPPRLVVLSACHSGDLAAPGLQLAKAGVPAVIAMQDRFSFPSAKIFFPTLFRELCCDGCIDRAVALARSQIMEQSDMAAPVLYMSLKSGLLWREPGQEAHPAPLLIPAPPRQIPPPPPDFVGREKELEALRIMVERDGTVIVGVHGLGGIGKTALACKLAKHLGIRYPDGHLMLDLRGTEPDKALPPEQILAHILHSYDREARLPDALPALQSRYRELLTGGRVLLLLDNARDAEQIAPLLPPPPGCLALVTSRVHFAVPGMRDLKLEELSEPDAVRMVLEIDPRVGDAARELAHACGRLPLAIRAVASLLHIHDNLSPRDLLKRMMDETRRLELSEAESALRLSYKMLPRRLKEKWRKLGVFVGDFDLTAAAWVWGAVKNYPPKDVDQSALDAAKDSLGELMAYSLVDYASERYRLHDLARIFAASRMGAEAPGSEAYAARLAHAGYYERLLRTCSELYYQKETIITGLALFDHERRDIAAGQAWVALAGETERERLELCSRYPEAGASVLKLRLHPHERGGWLEDGLRAAQVLGKLSLEGKHLTGLGAAWADLGDMPQAITCYERALVIARETGDRRGEAGALSNLGLAYADLGEMQRAIPYHLQALVINREIGDRRSEGKNLGNLGIVYYYLGDALKAIEYYEQDLVIARETGDRSGEGAVLGNLGLAFSHCGDPQRAIEYHEQALVIDREIGSRSGEAQCLGNLGIAYKDLRNAQKAIEYHQQALAIDRELGDRFGEEADLGDLGLVYADLVDARQAIPYYEQALTIAREIGERRGEAIALCNLGWAFLDMSDTQRASAYLELALAIDREIGDEDGIAVCSRGLGLAYEKLGDLARAVELLQISVDYRRKIGHPDAEKEAAQVAEIRKRIEAREG